MNSQIIRNYRNHHVSDRRLESALFSWKCNQANLWCMLSEPLLCQKATKIRQLCNQSLPTKQQCSMKFCDAWLSNFKSRCELRHFMPHGECGAADEPASEKPFRSCSGKFTNLSNGMSSIRMNVAYFISLIPMVLWYCAAWLSAKNDGKYHCDGLRQWRWI